MNPRLMVLAVGFVGSTMVLSVVGIIALAVLGQPVPDVLQNVAVGSVTGLLGLLAIPQTDPPEQPDEPA